MTTETLTDFIGDATELTQPGVDVVDARMELRETDSDEYVYVVVEAKAPTDADTWPVGAVQAIREVLRARAAESGVEPRLVVVFVAQPGTGDPMAFPEDAPPPRHDP